MSKTGSSILATTLLCTAIFAPDAQALSLSRTGTGQASLVPYFTVEDGRSTLLSINNNAAHARLMRVVVAEARNGRPTLAFNLYLGQYDSWSAALTRDGDDVALVTSDDACILDAEDKLAHGRLTLSNAAYTGTRSDGLGTDAARLASGMIEIIEMGHAPNYEESLAATSIDEHRCDEVAEALQLGGQWEVDPNLYVQPPLGELAVQAQILDVQSGVAFDMKPVMIDGFSQVARHARVAGSIDAVRITNPVLKAEEDYFLVNDTLLVERARAADAVSLLFMATELNAPFNVSEGVSATSRVVVTFPTRRAYLDTAEGISSEKPSDRWPFDTTEIDGEQCIEADRYIDAKDTLHFDAQHAPLCHQVNVLDIDASEDPFSTYALDAGRVVFDFAPRPDTGPRRIVFHSASDRRTNYVTGLPALSTSLIEFRNANARPGMLAAYAITERGSVKRMGSQRVSDITQIVVDP